MLLNISLGDLLSQTTAATALALQAATIYDDKILFGEKKSPVLKNGVLENSPKVNAY